MRMQWFLLRHAYFIKGEDFAVAVALLDLALYVLVGTDSLRFLGHSPDKALFGMVTSALLFIVALCGFVIVRMFRTSKYKVETYIMPVLIICNIASVFYMQLINKFVGFMTLQLPVLIFLITGYPYVWLVAFVLVGMGGGLIAQSVVCSVALTSGCPPYLWVDVGLYALQMVSGAVAYFTVYELGILIVRYKRHPARYLDAFSDLTALDTIVFSPVFGLGGEAARQVQVNQLVAPEKPHLDGLTFLRSASQVSQTTNRLVSRSFYHANTPGSGQTRDGHPFERNPPDRAERPSSANLSFHGNPSLAAHHGAPHAPSAPLGSGAPGGAPAVPKALIQHAAALQAGVGSGSPMQAAAGLVGAGRPSVPRGGHLQRGDGSGGDSVGGVCPPTSQGLVSGAAGGGGAASAPSSTDDRSRPPAAEPAPSSPVEDRHGGQAGGGVVGLLRGLTSKCSAALSDAGRRVGGSQESSRWRSRDRLSSRSTCEQHGTGGHGKPGERSSVPILLPRPSAAVTAGSGGESELRSQCLSGLSTHALGGEGLGGASAVSCASSQSSKTTRTGKAAQARSSSSDVARGRERAEPLVSETVLHQAALPSFSSSFAASDACVSLSYRARSRKRALSVDAVGRGESGGADAAGRAAKSGRGRESRREAGEGAFHEFSPSSLAKKEDVFPCDERFAPTAGATGFASVFPLFDGESSFPPEANVREDAPKLLGGAEVWGYDPAHPPAGYARRATGGVDEQSSQLPLFPSAAAEAQVRSALQYHRRWFFSQLLHFRRARRRNRQRGRRSGDPAAYSEDSEGADASSDDSTADARRRRARRRSGCSPRAERYDSGSDEETHLWLRARDSEEVASDASEGSHERSRWRDVSASSIDASSDAKEGESSASSGEADDSYALSGMQCRRLRRSDASADASVSTSSRSPARCGAGRKGRARTGASSVSASSFASSAFRRYLPFLFASGTRRRSSKPLSDEEPEMLNEVAEARSRRWGSRRFSAAEGDVSEGVCSASSAGVSAAGVSAAGVSAAGVSAAESEEVCERCCEASSGSRSSRSCSLERRSRGGRFSRKRRAKGRRRLSSRVRASSSSSSPSPARRERARDGDYVAVDLAPLPSRIFFDTFLNSIRRAEQLTKQASAPGHLPVFSVSASSPAGPPVPPSSSPSTDGARGGEAPTAAKPASGQPAAGPQVSAQGRKGASSEGLEKYYAMLLPSLPPFPSSRPLAVARGKKGLHRVADASMSARGGEAGTGASPQSALFVDGKRLAQAVAVSASAGLECGSEGPGRDEQKQGLRRALCASPADLASRLHRLPRAPALASPPLLQATVATCPQPPSLASSPSSGLASSVCVQRSQSVAAASARVSIELGDLARQPSPPHAKLAHTHAAAALSPSSDPTTRATSVPPRSVSDAGSASAETEDGSEGAVERRLSSVVVPRDPQELHRCRRSWSACGPATAGCASGPPPLADRAASRAPQVDGAAFPMQDCKRGRCRRCGRTCRHRESPRRGAGCGDRKRSAAGGRERETSDRSEREERSQARTLRRRRPRRSRLLSPAISTASCSSRERRSRRAVGGVAQLTPICVDEDCGQGDDLLSPLLRSESEEAPGDVRDSLSIDSDASCDSRDLSGRQQGGRRSRASSLPSAAEGEPAGEPDQRAGGWLASWLFGPWGVSEGERGGGGARGEKRRDRRSRRRRHSKVSRDRLLVQAGYALSGEDATRAFADCSRKAWLREDGSGASTSQYSSFGRAGGRRRESPETLEPARSATAEDDEDRLAVSHGRDACGKRRRKGRWASTTSPEQREWGGRGAWHTTSALDAPPASPPTWAPAVPTPSPSSFSFSALDQEADAGEGRAEAAAAAASGAADLIRRFFAATELHRSEPRPEKPEGAADGAVAADAAAAPLHMLAHSFATAATAEGPPSPKAARDNLSSSHSGLAAIGAPRSLTSQASLPRSAPAQPQGHAPATASAPGSAASVRSSALPSSGRAGGMPSATSHAFASTASSPSGLAAAADLGPRASRLGLGRGAYRAGTGTRAAPSTKATRPLKSGYISSVGGGGGSAESSRGKMTRYHIVQKFHDRLPWWVARIIVYSDAALENCRRRRRLMQRATWRTKVAMPVRNMLGLFSDEKIETWYVQWLNAFNAKYYPRVAWLLFLVCLYATAFHGLLRLRNFVDNYPLCRDAVRDSPLGEIGFFTLVAVRFASQPILSMLLLLPVLRHSGSKIVECFTSRGPVTPPKSYKLYRWMLGLSLLQFAYSVFDNTWHLFAAPPTRHISPLTIIPPSAGLEVAVVQTVFILAVRTPTINVIFCLYFIVYLLIFFFVLPAGAQQAQLFAVSLAGWLFTCIGGQLFYTRAFEVNRRRLFCKYVLPYMLYLEEIAAILYSNPQGEYPPDEGSDDEVSLASAHPAVERS
ncbi:hypothetical protein BESB_081570 [Besnoitia besnoiti]|uniref:Transmembrane protein n=1 Tax=Besnoitia besnoiti TaxID=94643 RepID=A0A2A9M389_BESBE|nr:hypothetical protein BESB_081570 [Besnoitia besnoiti]PFH32958.1 hypothetical protein BESB_081570 [Besnoitia besnoiti]